MRGYRYEKARNSFAMNLLTNKEDISTLETNNGRNKSKNRVLWKLKIGRISSCCSGKFFGGGDMQIGP